MRKALSRSIMEKKVRAVGTTFMLLLFMCVHAVNVKGEEMATETGEKPELRVVSSRASDQGVYLFLKNTDDSATVTKAQIGNKTCETSGIQDVTSMGLPVRTVIMLDNSISLGNSWGEEAIALINELLDNHAEGEVFRIATFSTDVTELSDYSDNYEVLKATVNQISFENQDTYLSEMLYTYLEDADDERANYTRFIIIADGADDNEISYTQMELTDLMKNSGVVIHTVGLKGRNNAELLETLFSYARLTGGTYSVAETGSDIGEICSTIDDDYGLHYVELLPDTSDMDGSRKEIKLSIQTGTGEATIKTSSRMPFGNASIAASEEVDIEKDEESIPEPQKPLPVIQTEPAEEKTTGIPMWIWIAALAAGAVIAVLLIVRNGKRRIIIQPLEKDTVSSPQSVGTRILSAEEVGGKYVVLTDIENPRRNYRTQIVTNIVIGRETGEIKIDDDDAVSGKQCEIVKKGKLYYLNDLDSSNGTYYEGNRIYSEVPIMDGGMIGFGAHKYRIRIG